MNSTPQRTFGLIRKHPVLLLGPMLGAAVINFIVYRVAGYYRDLYFPRIGSQAMHAMRLASRADGAASRPALLTAEHGIAMRGLILFGSGVFQAVLAAFAVALTVALAAQLYRHGKDSIAAAIERLRLVPRLTWTLVRLALRTILVGTAVILAMAMAGGLMFLIFGRHPDPSAPLHGWFWQLAAFLLVCVSLGTVASLVMPHFLDVTFQIEHESRPGDAAGKWIETRAVRFAWIAAAAIACLGLLVGGVNLAIAGGQLLPHTFSAGIEEFIEAIVEEIPVIVLVVAVALLVARANELAIESEHGRATS